MMLEIITTVGWLVGYCMIAVTAYKYGQFKAMDRLTKGTDDSERAMYRLMRLNGYSTLLFVGWKPKEKIAKTWCEEDAATAIKLAQAAERLYYKRALLEAPAQGKA